MLIDYARTKTRANTELFFSSSLQQVVENAQNAGYGEFEIAGIRTAVKQKASFSTKS